MRFNRLFFKTKSIEDRKYIRYVYFKKLLMKHLIFHSILNIPLMI